MTQTPSNLNGQGHNGSALSFNERNRMQPEAHYDVFDRLTPEGQEVAMALGLNYRTIIRFDHDKARRSAFSGTDLPKMLALIDEEYGTFRTVIAEKLGMLDKDAGRESNIPMELGSYMEPFMLSKLLIDQRDYLAMELAMRQAPMRITLNEYFKHDTLNFGVSMDAIVWIGDTIALHAEFKTTHSFWDEIPDKVMAQVQGQIMATNGKANESVIYSIEGGNLVFKKTPVFVDVEWRQRITDVLVEGQKWLDRGELPPLTFTPKEKAKGAVTPRATHIVLAEALDQAIAAKKRAEEREKRIKAIFARHMKLGHSIKMPFGSVTYSSRKTGGELTSKGRDSLIAQIDAWIEGIADEETLQEYKDMKANAIAALTTQPSESFGVTYRPKAVGNEE